MKVFDWKLPLAADGSAATISGTLTWLGKDGGGFPVAAAISLGRRAARGRRSGAVVRRRRRAPGEREQVEAW